MATSRKEIKELIESNPGVVEFGTSEDGISDEWLAKAENALNVKLPPSYIWFLKNYSGGEIGGEEIYSIYGIEFEDAVGGDVVYIYLTNRKNGQLDDTKIAICETDFGETFYFDTKKSNNGEFPVYLSLSGTGELYADDFLEFLKKRIEVHTS